ncbi:hypothetical protein [Hymenobacter sp. UYP22]|uniref:hypothetical protein n=1 Tax=Hymenobacter sp. UYP22 TaxID=3156348 RepID=UPI0033945CCF
MRSFYSYLLAVCLLFTGATASAAPATLNPDGPGKPALVTTLPARPALASAQQQSPAEQAAVASPEHAQKKKKSGSSKVWLLLGIGAALALVRILL